MARAFTVTNLIGGRRVTQSILLAVTASLGFASYSIAQELVRPSMTRVFAPDNRAFVEEDPNYNARFGPVSLLLDASVFAEYNDNINISDVNKVDDIIIRPSIGVTAKWQLSDINTITLRVGTGYNFYLNDSRDSGSAFNIDPGSELAFNIYTGDFRIRVYDSFSLTSTPIDSVGFSDVVDFGQFSNTIGVAVTWELADFATTVGYSHNWIIGTSGDFDYLNSNTDQIYGSIYYAITPTWGVGIEGAISATRYDQDVQNDADSFHTGVFVEGTISEAFSFRAAVGYQSINFDNSGKGTVSGIIGSLGSDTNDFNGVYANLGFTHHLNAYITQDLTIGREALLGVNSNYIELFYVRHTAKWEIIKDIDLVTSLFYEKGDESGDVNAENATRYGGSIGASYQFAPTWILSAEYGFIKKDSNLADRDYTQNRIIVGITYEF